MSSYLDDDWRCIPDNLPPTFLYNTLRQVRPNLAVQYSTPQALNGLITWTNYADPWPIKAFVLRYGLGHPQAGRLTVKEIAEHLGKNRYAVQRATGKNGVPHRLTMANGLLRGAPEQPRLFNEFRAIGLQPDTWTPIAKNASIYTVGELCNCTEDFLSDLPNISDDKIADIAACLASVGLALRG